MEKCIFSCCEMQGVRGLRVVGGLRWRSVAFAKLTSSLRGAPKSPLPQNPLEFWNLYTFLPFLLGVTSTYKFQSSWNRTGIFQNETLLARPQTPLLPRFQDSRAIPGELELGWNIGIRVWLDRYLAFRVWLDCYLAEHTHSRARGYITGFNGPRSFRPVALIIRC